MEKIRKLKVFKMYVIFKFIVGKVFEMLYDFGYFFKVVIYIKI